MLIRRYSSSFTTIYNEINLLSKKKKTSVNLNNLLEYGINKESNKRLIASQFLYNELPIRFSHKIKDLDSLDDVLCSNNHINTIRNWYITSVYDIKNSKYPKNIEDSKLFLPILENIYTRHSSTLITMANAIQDTNKTDLDNLEINLQNFLNKFYIDRIGIRVLLKHYISLFEKNNNFGIIDINCSPYEILNLIKEDIKIVCENNFLDNISININKNLITLPYINSHLYYILFEIIKNSVAKMKKHKNNYKPNRC